MPQQIARRRNLPALEKGTIDAAEWVGPYDDDKLGFCKVAQYYYYPAGGTAVRHCIRSVQPGKVATSFRRATRHPQVGLRAANGDMLANYDSKNPTGVTPAGGGRRELRPFSQRYPSAPASTRPTQPMPTSAHESRLQEDLRQPDGVPQGRLSVGADSGIHLRHSFMMLQQQGGKI